MNEMDNILRAEAERTGHYGADEVTVPECPCCGGDTWEYLLEDVNGRIVGCSDCVTKDYGDDLKEDIYG